MSVNRLADDVAMMAALVDGCTYELDVPWPLHQALTHLRADLLRVGAEPPLDLELGLLDDVGVGVPAAGAAVLALLRDGRFSYSAQPSRQAALSPQAAVAARRASMRLDARHVALLYRAARIWATAASTLSKKLETPRASPRGTLAVSDPNRRQLPLAVM